MKNDAPRERGAERTDNVSPSTVPFTLQSLADVAEEIAARTMPAEQKVRILLSIVRGYAGPDAMLDYYFALLGANVADAAHAIEAAELGQKAGVFALDDPAFRPLYVAALSEVREERQRRDALRAQYDRTAAALLATTRLISSERSVAA